MAFPPPSFRSFYQFFNSFQFSFSLRICMYCTCLSSGWEITVILNRINQPNLEMVLIYEGKKMMIVRSTYKLRILYWQIKTFYIFLASTNLFINAKSHCCKRNHKCSRLFVLNKKLVLFKQALTASVKSSHNSKIECKYFRE